MGSPEKILKERQKEERRRDKIKAKLEKKLKSGKIDRETYQQELHKIGYVTQQELLSDLRKMIQDEISYLENLETADDTGRVPPVSASAPPPRPPRPPRAPHFGPEPYTAARTDAYRTGPERGFEFKKPPGYDKYPATEPGHEDELIELSGDDVDWEFEEDAEEPGPVDDYAEDEPDKDTAHERESDFIDGDHDLDHEIGVVKVDVRTGVVDYADIKTFKVSEDTITDQLEHAAVLGEEPRQKKKKKLKKLRLSEEDLEEEEPEPELTETERLIRDMETAPSEKFDLDEVFIPDLKSARKTGAADILWEADEDDQIWLDRKFLEAAEVLKLEHMKWRLQMRRFNKQAELRRKREMAEHAEDWELVKLVRRKVMVRVGKKRIKKLKKIWKARVVDADNRMKDRDEKKIRSKHADADDFSEDEWL